MAIPAIPLASIGLSLAGKAFDALSTKAHPAKNDAAASPNAGAQKDPRLWKQASDFETMFMENMMGHMVQGLQGEGPLGDAGTGADVYRSMLTQEHAKALSAAGGIGIAPAVYAELLKMQEKAHG